MSRELIEGLRYLANRPPYSGAADIILRAADALEAKAAPVGELSAGQEPVAYITGYYNGRCIIAPVNRAAVLPSGMALYSTPQPSEVNK